jgi:hypothetical protein
MITCILHYAEWKGDNPETLDAVEFAFKLVAYILIPFVLIVYSDFSLMLYLRNARQVRKRVLEEAIKINERNILEKRPNQRGSVNGEVYKIFYGSNIKPLNVIIILCDYNIDI